MFDNSFGPQPRRSMFDSAYPSTKRFVESVDLLGAEEVLPTRVSGEVELIARSSYRLGHAESLASSEALRAEELKSSLRSTNKLLEDAQRDVRIYKNRAGDFEDELERMRSEMIQYREKFVRLDKQVHPAKYKKATAKKVSKK